MEPFRKGRDFAAWLGLAHAASTGGKQKLGATSKMGERTLRRLLIPGAAALVRLTSRRAPPQGSWLARMLSRKPRMLVITALARRWGARSGRCWRVKRFTALTPRRLRSSDAARGPGGVEEGRHGATVDETRPSDSDRFYVPSSTQAGWSCPANLQRGRGITAPPARPDRWQYPTTRQKARIPLASPGASTDDARSKPRNPSGRWSIAHSRGTTARRLGDSKVLVPAIA